MALGLVLGLAGGAAQARRAKPVSVAPAGAATAAFVASSGSRPEGLAVDDDNLYWTDLAGDVRAVPLRGGPPTLLATGQLAPGAIAAGGGQVVWLTADGVIATVPAAGGAVVTLYAAGRQLASLALDADRAYVTDAGAGQVLSLPRQGGAPTTLATGLARPYGVAVDDGVYVTCAGGPGGEDGEVLRLDKKSAATPPVTLASKLRLPTALALGTGAIYLAAWAVDGAPTEEVASIPRKGGPPTVLAKNDRLVASLALAGAYLYATATSAAQAGDLGGTLQAIAVGAADSVEVLSTDVAPPGPLALGGGFVYVASGERDGSIVRLPLVSPPATAPASTASTTRSPTSGPAAAPRSPIR
jgi:hypothetical protein